ncbi:ATP-binding protein [Streptomyces sioyaensis]|uniref:LuxR family transcriptional regulator n=1 Tax=Streptomyces sioyaensis TaxID=67364 RepID=A0A4Q1R1P7_9ACTN|nr:LuxR C-terminal-related transcriptional regulator [Streptomyces sioyaensis]RXS66634.1 LuxR family transcriptional regulator [Streptomyces sioyaensis]
MGGRVWEAGVLPAEVTRFIGRRREMSQARALMSRGRLVTLTGPGGIGKTRLALRVAAEVRRSFPGGVWLVELAALEDGEQLAQTVAARLRLGNEAIRDPLATLVDHVADQRLLLVLDNCEHVLDDCAALVGTVLRAAPDVQVLTTSRQMLGVGGECVFPVPPMVLSGDGAPPELCEAVALFADRAAAVRPDFELTVSKAAVVDEICRRLDGVPLAIELAAAQLRALSAEEILSRLDDRFRMLTAGSRAALPRQRTLRAAIDWSHDLCTSQERLLWSRLSVFSGGFDLDAVDQVCSGTGIERGQVLGVLVGLVDKSVLACEERGSRMRYWLLDTLRQYGREQLAASGEEHALRERHRDYYRTVAEQAEAEWFGPDQMGWFTRLRMEHHNFRSALEFCADEPGAADTALGLAASMWIHRLGFGSFNEGRQWLGRALARDEEPSPVRVKALFVDGLLAVLQGDIDAAQARVEHCRALLPALGDDPDLSRATVTLDGLVALFQGDFPRAVSLLEDALARHQAADDAGNAAVTSFMLATACVNLDDPAATVHAERCLALCEAHGAQWSRTHALWVLGLDHFRCGRHRRAGTLIRHALRDKPLSYDQWGVAQCLEVLGWCAAAAGLGERAATLVGAAEATWEVAGSALTGLGHLQAGHEQCTSALRAELGDAAFAAAVRAGKQLTLEQSVAYAWEESGTPGPPPAPQEAPVQLTRRERQVAELVAEGRTNKEIAAKLTISRRTAEGHVEHILTKLGFTSRAQIAAWAARNDTGDQIGDHAV